MYLEACLQQRIHFYYFVASVNRIMAVEATDTPKRLSSRLTTKWRQPYSWICGYFMFSIAITLGSGRTLMHPGSRVPAHRTSVSGIYLFM